MIQDNSTTIVIGKNSNFSNKLKLSIKNVVLLSSKNIESELSALNINGTINIIFNNFQTASKLNDISKAYDYIERALSTTALVLDFIKENTISINKIIYTSSSSVYGNNILCHEHDALTPLNIHASLKLANEKLIEKFAVDNDIDFTIARVFNMYGGDDTFSIISKIINAYKENTILHVINNGNGIRDFIHIDDVVNIYKVLLTCKGINVLNVGTGEGVSIKNIMDYLHNHNIHIQTDSIKRDELKISTADNSILMEMIGAYSFIDVQKYIINQIEKINLEK